MMNLETAKQRAFDRLNLIGEECDIYKVLYQYKAIRELPEEQIDVIYDEMAEGLFGCYSGKTEKNQDAGRGRTERKGGLTMEKWQVFRDKNTGRMLLAYTLDGTFPGERESTLEHLSYEKDIPMNQIQITTETKFTMYLKDIVMYCEMLDAGEVDEDTNIKYLDILQRMIDDHLSRAFDVYQHKPLFDLYFAVKDAIKEEVE